MTEIDKVFFFGNSVDTIGGGFLFVVEIVGAEDGFATRDEEWVASNATADIGIPTPTESLIDESSASVVEKNPEGEGGVDIVATIEVTTETVIEKKGVKGIFLGFTAWIICRAEVGAVHASKTAIPRDIVGQGEGGAVTSTVIVVGGISDDFGI